MKKNIVNQAPSLLLLIVLVGFPQISETIFTPSLPAIATSYEATMRVTQLTMSIYFIAFALGVFVWGWLSDSIGRRKAILYGIVFYAVGSLLCYVSQTIEFLLFARFIQAFGASTGSVTTQTILRESYDGTKRQVLFAQISAALAFTPALGPLIGGFIGQYGGFRMVFFTLVLMSVGLFIYSYYCLPETSTVATRRRVALMPVFKRLIMNKKVLAFGAVIGIINGVLFSYYAEAPYIFITHFTLTPASYGFIGVIVATATFVGAMLSKKLTPHYRAQQVILLGLIIMLAGAVVMFSFALATALPHLLQMTGLLVAIFIMLMGSGTALPSCLSLALVDFADVIGTAGAIFSLGYYLVVSAVTFGMSYLHNGLLTTMPLYFIVLTLVMLITTRKYIKV